MFRMDKIDRKKVGKGALIAMGGALLTYFESWIITVDFGVYTVLVMAANSVFVNFANKLLSGPVKPPVISPEIKPSV